MTRSYTGLIVLTVISGLVMLLAAVLALVVAPDAAGLPQAHLLSAGL